MTILRQQARGDMYMEAIVETPVKLTERQRQLLREFADGRHRRGDTARKATASSPRSRNSGRT